MKRKIYLLLVYMGILLIASCGMEEMGVGNIQNSGNDNKGDLPEWNKNKTIEIYYLSNLKDAPIAANEQEYSKISHFFSTKGKSVSIGVIDRADVKIKDHNMFNGSTAVSFESIHFSCFAFNKYIDSSIQGSAILFNHKINSQSSFKVTDDCYFKYIKILAKTTTNNPLGIEVPFSTVRFDSKSQVSASEVALKKLSETAVQALIVGTIKTDLLTNLEAVAGKLAGYNLKEAAKDKNTGFSIFMLAPKSWVLRETTAEALNKGVTAYCLHVEAGVE